ncbi:MAG: hypothetical protein LW860_19230 [Xanthomonadaceae bacterium]|jgi:hypothetical protein|nr:hypothetical protein [Xanthomonadaceae bacterium]
MALSLLVLVLTGGSPSNADDEFDVVHYTALPIDLGIGGRRPFVIDRRRGIVAVGDTLAASDRCLGFPGFCFHSPNGPIAVPSCLGENDAWKWGGGGVTVERRGSPFALKVFERTLSVVTLSVTDDEGTVTVLLVDKELGVVAISFDVGTKNAFGPYVLASGIGLGAGQTCTDALPRGSN